MNKRQLADAYFIRTKVSRGDLRNAQEDAVIYARPIPWGEDSTLLRGKLFECNSFLQHVSNHPKDLILERWTIKDSDIWQRLEIVTYKDVEWIKMEHTSDGSHSACAGEAWFKYKEKIVEIADGKEVVVNSNTSGYQTIALHKYLKEELTK